jgi:uncharacterized Fe-S cluster protein YjdI
MDQIIKHYTNDEVTVVWKPNQCIHSTICFRGLPGVFDPRVRPWVNIKGSETAGIVEQVKQCPSGALSYYYNAEENKEAETMDAKVEVLPNGPLLVYGTLHIKDRNGNESTRNKTTAFCRCGASKNKPYCDGSHVGINFSDE